MNKIVFYSCLLGLFAALIGCSDSDSTSDQNNEAQNPQPGEYYWIISSEGDYKVLKVLVVKSYDESKVIHLCYYNNVFNEPPTNDVIPSLYFGTYPLNDFLLDRLGRVSNTGRKHMAILQKAWVDLEPHFIENGSVTPDELEPYEKWKNGKRQCFGTDIVITN